ncbi:MAG: hypothetical protein ACOCXT_04075 [Candidatus Dojkabacteria bacterium]
MLKRILAREEAFVRKNAQEPGFHREDPRFGEADIVYASVYNIATDWVNNHCPLLCFENLPEELQVGNRRR